MGIKGMKNEEFRDNESLELLKESGIKYSFNNY